MSHMSAVALAKCYCSSSKSRKIGKRKKYVLKKRVLYYLILWRTYTEYHVIILPKNLSLARATI